MNIFKGLLLSLIRNVENRNMAKTFAKVDMGDWKKIKYSKVVFTWLFERTKYNKFIQSIN